MNNQDPQTAIDYNLYPSSARPSGLHVSQGESLTQCVTRQNYEIAQLKSQLAAFHTAMQRERKPDWEKWHMDLADIVDSISSTDEVASIKTPVSQLDVPGTLKTAARELRYMATSFTLKANFVPTDLEIKALKEQVESLEKQCAAILRFLQSIIYGADKAVRRVLVDLEPVRQVLSTTAGRNHKSPEEVAAIVEQARQDAVSILYDEGYKSSEEIHEILTAHTQALKVARDILERMDTQMAALSTKNIPVRERLIFALDVANQSQAEIWVDKLGDSVLFYKLGLELFMSGNYFPLIDLLHKKGKKVFVDIKINDVPETVKASVRQLKHSKIEFLTVHADSEATVRAVNEEKNGIKVLAVTVLTSLDEDNIREMGFTGNVEDLALVRARRALALGCDGVVSSGKEASKLRATFGDRLLIVIPGIRASEQRGSDDQKRTVDVEEAFLNGADYIVVGRPIRNAEDPKAKADEIQRRIAELFESLRTLTRNLT